MFRAGVLTKRIIVDVNIIKIVMGEYFYQICFDEKQMIKRACR